MHSRTARTLSVLTGLTVVCAFSVQSSVSAAYATSSFKITKLSPNPMVVKANGAKKTLTIDWTGTASFPMTVYSVPVKGHCTTSSFSCHSGKHTFSSGTHVLKEPGWYCTGSNSTSFHGEFYVYLVDSAKLKTPKALLKYTCNF
jgi:hypothetical protein